MRVIADTHVHLYPCYDIRRSLDALRGNLSRLDGQAVCLGFLAERRDCRCFQEMRDSGAGLSGSGLETECLDNALRFREQGRPDLYLFPGRQIITRERIEILALTVDLEIEDGLPAQEVVDRILQGNGLPVVSWAPGKWFFKRGEVVERLLAENKPGALFLGDTTLRPAGWGLPLIMGKGLRKGFALVSGSDPLPFAGEEQFMGRYGVAFDCDFDPRHPAQSIRAVFSRPGFRPCLVGRRGTVVQTLCRLYKNARSKQAPVQGPSPI